MSLYSMIAMVPNNPYDVMGSWCGDSAWLYGNLVPLADTFDIDAEIRSDWEPYYCSIHSIVVVQDYEPPDPLLRGVRPGDEAETLPQRRQLLFAVSGGG